MESGLVTRLTAEAVKAVYDQPERKLKAVVQFLGATSKPVRDKTIYVARISDGSFASNFVVYPQVSEQLLALLKPFDVIEAGLTKRDAASNYLILYEFRLVYAGLEGEIGRPVEFAPGAENVLGDARIPEKVLSAQLGARAPRASVEPEAAGGNARAGPVRRLAEEGEAPYANYTLVANLNMYDRSWTIRGRVVKKSDLKRFKSGGREGCVFSVVLRDEDCAIQASFFSDVAERFHAFLVEGRVYAFSDGEVKAAGRFNTTDNRYELVFSDKSVIKEVADDARIGEFHFKFATLEEVRGKGDADIFDVIGIVEDGGEVREMTLKDGSAKEKRTLVLLDHTGYRIEATLWGQTARESVFEPESVVVLQDMRVREYNGSKSLTSSMGTRALTRVPDCAQLKELLLFRNARRGLGDNLRSLSDNVTSGRAGVTKVCQLLQESERLHAEPEHAKLYFSLVAHSLRAVGNLFYDSCPSDTCMKKLAQSTFNSYFCEKCHKTVEAARPRFMSTIKLADDTGAVLVTFSGEEYCQTLFGCATPRLRELREGDESAYNDFVRERLYGEYQVRLLAKKDFFNGEAKIKFQAVRLLPLQKGVEPAAAALYQQLAHGRVAA